MENVVLDSIRTIRTLLGNSTFSIGVGAIIIIPYIVRNWSKIDEKETIINIVAIFLSVLPIGPGVAVILLSFEKETCELIKIEQKIFFVGGLVLVLVGLQGLRKNLKQ